MDRWYRFRPIHVPICVANYLWTIHPRANALRRRAYLLFCVSALDSNTSNMTSHYPLWLISSDADVDVRFFFFSLRVLCDLVQLTLCSISRCDASMLIANS